MMWEKIINRLFSRRQTIAPQTYAEYMKLREDGFCMRDGCIDCGGCDRDGEAPWPDVAGGERVESASKNVHGGPR